MLAYAIAHEAGATWFDLSPDRIDGKYLGRDAALMLHMVSGWGTASLGTLHRRTNPRGSD